MPALVRPLLLAALLAVLGLMVAATASRTQRLRADKAASRPAKAEPRSQSRFADPAPAPSVQPAPPEATPSPKRQAGQRRPGFRVVRVRAGRSILIHERANGRTIGRLAAATEFGSP